MPLQLVLDLSLHCGILKVTLNELQMRVVIWSESDARR